MATILTQKPMVPIIEVIENENRVVFEFGPQLREYNFFINPEQISTPKVLGDLQTAVQNNAVGDYFRSAIANGDLQPHPDNSELTEPILFSLDIPSF